jgi:hypothetical protein
MEALQQATILRSDPNKEKAMFKKCLSLMLVGSLTCTLIGGGAVAAQSQANQQTQLAEKMKAAILQRSIGKKARVTVKLRDNTKVAGYISKAGEDSFAVTNAKTGVATTIAYNEIIQVKNNGLSRGGKIAVGMGIVWIVLAIIGSRA